MVASLKCLSKVPLHYEGGEKALSFHGLPVGETFTVDTVL
jgi:hypothetical protein